jgi:hypothetical protein
MRIFPSGAWFLEPEFPDPLTWLDQLERIPVFTASTRCRAEIRHLSSCVCALSLPALESEVEDDSGEDELPDESPPVVAKVERARASKKSAVPGDASLIENKPPVCDMP